jgi:serine/threonine protein kinase
LLYNPEYTTRLNMLVQSDLHDGQHPINAQTEVAPLNLAPGSRWKNFTIEKKIGAGGFGVVYRALDTVLNRLVALKFVTTRDALREGKLLAKVKDQGVVAVHSIEEESSATAICMEFVRGVDLETYLARHHHRLHPMHAAMIGRSVCRSLAAVHRVKLLHRDVKPRNVIVSDDDRFVLVDFGLGVHFGSAACDSAGTLHYIAPERLERKEATQSSDIYGLGVLMFYLVSGEYPVAGISAEEVLGALRSGRRHHLADYVQVPPALESIIEQAIAPDPDQRFRSAGAMLAALDEFIRDRPIPLLRRKWVPYAGVAVLAIAASTVAFRYATAPAPQTIGMQLNREDGIYHDVSLSDDGKVAVFTSDRGDHGDSDVWAEHLGKDDPIPLSPRGSNEHEAAISPDGSMAAYRSERDNGAIYINSTFGQHERLFARFGRHPRFSPDGTRLAYWTGEEGNSTYPSGRCFVQSLSGGAPTQVLPDFADCRFPVWSPDGKYLLVTATQPNNVAPLDDRDWWLVSIKQPSDRTRLHLYPVIVDGAALRMHLYPPHWAGSKIVFAAHQEHTGRVWQITIKNKRLAGPPIALSQRTESDDGEPWNLPDGTVAFSNFHGRINVWTLALDSRSADAVRLSWAKDYQLAPHVSSDGRYVLFTGLVGNIYSAWLRDMNASKPEPLSFTPDSPAILSPDGQRIFYSEHSSEHYSLFEYVLRTKENRRICDYCGTPLDFLADKNQLICSDNQTLSLIDAVNGHSVPLLAQAGRRLLDAAIAPARDRIAFVSRLDADHRQIVVARLNGTSAEQTSIWQTTEDGWSEKPRWSADASKLYFYSTHDGFGCFYVQSFDRHGKPQGDIQPLKHFHDVKLSTLELSQSALDLGVGGHKLFFALDSGASDIWIQRPQKR